MRRICITVVMLGVMLALLMPVNAAEAAPASVSGQFNDTTNVFSSLFVNAVPAAVWIFLFHDGRTKDLLQAIQTHVGRGDWQYGPSEANESVA